MLTTIELIELLRQKLGNCTPYRLALVLEISHPALSYYRNGTRFLDDKTALKAASMLDLPPAYVLACVHAEREKDSAVIAFWASLAQAHAPTEWPCLMVQEKLAV